MIVNKAFTLIELLVVIAIIAIISAILFPVFAKVREKARQTSCASNEKQLGLAIMQYVQDFDETYPRKEFYYDGQYVSWRQVVFAYTKSTQVYNCPSNPISATDGNAAITINGVSYPFIRGGYAINGHFGDDNSFNMSTTTAMVQSPASKIIVSECRYSWNIYMGGSDNWTNANGSAANGGWAGHIGCGNYIFSDGHVKAMNPVATTSPLNMWGGLASGVCGSDDINCDTPEPQFIDAQQAVQARYQ